MKIDYGTVITSASPSFGDISADVSASTLSIVGKYNVTERFSVLGGLKQVSSSGGPIELPLPTGGDPLASGWLLGHEDGTGYILGVGYEIPEIALRAALTYESAIDLAFPTTATAGGAIAGTTTGGIGDAWNLQFQSGIAQNTLIFGNIRYSMWEDNQVSVPTGGGPAQISDFEDGYSISLGIARRINESWAVSGSIFYDPADDCGSASELSPQCENTALSLGARHTLDNGTNIDFGATYSKRGDATTGLIGASLTDSKVISAGIKVSKSF